MEGEEGAWADNYCGPATTIPPEAMAWVEGNQQAIELTHAAARRAACWFDDAGDPYHIVLAPIRRLARLLLWRARVAAAAGDWATLAEALLTIDRLGRHVATKPLLVDVLTGNSLRALALDEVRTPLCSPYMSAAERAAYAARILPVLDTVNVMPRTLAGEQEFAVWTFPDTVAGVARVLAPPRRFAGEVALVMPSIQALAAAPVEEVFDPGSAVCIAVARINAQLAAPTGMNLPRRVTSVLVAGWLNSIRGQVRLAAQQRGTRALLEIFLHRDRNGKFPAALSELEDAPPDCCIDPYTGRPFVYGLDGGSFVLYSCGPDRDDDGGRQVRRPDPGADVPDCDLVFWPISQE
jgi:hypothetical protein